jgi:hypothetical protein
MSTHANQQAHEQFDELLARIVGEYTEMPGLSLTFAQAQRLWALDSAVCHSLLDHLVGARCLRITPRGRYVLSESAPRSQRAVLAMARRRLRGRHGDVHTNKITALPIRHWTLETNRFEKFESARSLDTSQVDDL